MNDFFKKNNSYLAGVSLLIITAFVLLLQMNKGAESIFFSQYHSSLGTLFFKLGTHAGEPYVYAIGCIAFLFYQFRYVISTVFLSALVGVSAVILKTSFAHARPVTYFREVLHQPESINLVLEPHEMNDSWTTSFPSGHTMSAFAFYGFLALIAPKHWMKVLCLLAAAWVGLSRMYLIQHFLEDVTAGMVVGTIIAFVVYNVNNWLGEKEWAVKSLRRTAA